MEIKSLGNPPNAVKVTLAGIVILNMNYIRKLGGDVLISTTRDEKTNQLIKSENYFETAKRFLLQSPDQLLQILLNYDKSQVNDAMIQTLKEKVQDQPDFNLQSVQYTSFATKFLFIWINCIVKWYEVWKESKPTRDKLDEMKNLLRETKAKLKKKQQEYDEVSKVIQ